MFTYDYTYFRISDFINFVNSAKDLPLIGDTSLGMIYAEQNGDKYAIRLRPFRENDIEKTPFGIVADIWLETIGPCAELIEKNVVVIDDFTEWAYNRRHSQYYDSDYEAFKRAAEQTFKRIVRQTAYNFASFTDLKDHSAVDGYNAITGILDYELLFDALKDKDDNIIQRIGETKDELYERYKNYVLLTKNDEFCSIIDDFLDNDTNVIMENLEKYCGAKDMRMVYMDDDYCIISCTVRRRGVYENDRPILITLVNNSTLEDED